MKINNLIKRKGYILVFCLLLLLIGFVLYFHSYKNSIKNVIKPRFNLSENDTLKRNNRSINDTVSSYSSIKADKINESFTPFTKKSELFVIDNRKDTCIKTIEGSLIYLPRKCFTLEGKDYDGIVNFEVKEVTKKSDFIKVGLQTVTEKELLISAGMFFFTAQNPKGKALILNTKHKIYIEKYTSDLIGGMSLFHGKYSKGSIIWEQTGNIYNRMIPIPIRYLKLSSYLPSIVPLKKMERNRQLGISLERLLKDKNNNNTFLSTREFEARAFQYTGLIFSYNNPYKDSLRLLKHIFQNRDKDLYIVDSLLNQQYVNDYKAGLVENNKKWFKINMELINPFVKEKKTKIIDFTKYNIDYKKDIKSQLLLKGYSENEAEEVQRSYFIQQRLIADYEVNRRHNLPFYAFEINKLGWVNIDKLMALETEKIDFTFQLNKVLDNNIKIFIAFDRINSVISVYPDKNGICKINVPQNENVTIVAYNYKGDNVFFGYKKGSTNEKGLIIPIEIKPFQVVEKSIDKLFEK